MKHVYLTPDLSFIKGPHAINSTIIGNYIYFIDPQNDELWIAYVMEQEPAEKQTSLLPPAEILRIIIKPASSLRMLLFGFGSFIDITSPPDPLSDQFYRASGFIDWSERGNSYERG